MSKIWILDNGGYPISEVRLGVIDIDLAVVNYTDVEKTGDRFISGKWVDVPDNRGNWHDPASGQQLDIIERGIVPPAGYITGRSPQTILEKAKSQAHARIKQARDACEFGIFIWNGHAFDGDERSRGRLDGALEGAKEAIANGSTAWSKPWKLENNTVVHLSAPEMVEMVRAHYERMEFAHSTAGVLAYFIDTATTIEQLEAIQWPV
jgi:hypothetical protein